MLKNKLLEQRKEADNKGKNWISFILDIGLNALIIIVMVFLIRSYLISPFQVSGPSMCNTFNYINDVCVKGNGEYIIVNKFGYQNLFGWQVGLPKRGDVIIFHPPHNEQEFYIKRVIGIEGDLIEIKEGHVYVMKKDASEFEKLEENYLNEVNKGNTQPLLQSKKVFEVPEDSYFVLGDNRIQSTDSRSCFRDAFAGGCEGATPYLTMENIEGKAWLVLWPFESLRMIGGYDYGL